MIINTNVSALFTQRSIHNAESDMQVSMERLSSGKRINSAADDAAGLQITERFISQIEGSRTAERNASDAISVVQTAEAAYDSVSDMLQRMRELALQSTNGALNSDDRKSLDQEYQELSEEIGRMSDSTVFNNTKLLDGNYQDKVFQVGANHGDTMNISLLSAHPSDLGVSSQSTLTAQGSSEPLTNGDLEINGTDIGSALASYDSASVSNKTASAISKAAAINKHSEETGVVAQVNSNVVTGTTMDGSAATGTININGTDFAVTTTADKASTRAAMVSIINQKSGETGVVAIDTGDDRRGVQLMAEDGRNISITFDTVTDAGTGITTGDHYGSYTLTSDREINISRGSNDTVSGLQNAGLREGIYSTQEATISSLPDASTSWSRGDIIINGSLIGETKSIDDPISFANKTQSAIAKAAAINAQTEATGVTATVDTNRIDGHVTMNSAGSQAGGISINGVETASFTTSNDEALTRTMVVAAINAISDRTGVMAEDTGTTSGGVQLVAEDGRNITFSLTDGAGGAAAAGFTEEELGLAAAGTYEGSFTLHSASAIKVNSENASTFSTLNDFENVGTFGEGLNTKSIDRTHIIDPESAMSSVDSIDNAIDQINQMRGEMGAKQNRLEQTVKNLQNMSEHMDAARSRIEDANFATESTLLAKSKILQQASTAMLAQANQSGQQVMKLLQ